MPIGIYKRKPGHAKKIWITRRKNRTDKPTEKTRKKLSLAHKGISYEQKYGKIKADKIRKQISKSLSDKNHPLYGKHRSKKTIKKNEVHPISQNLV